MKRMWKRILALMLVIGMTFSATNVSVYAQENIEAVEDEEVVIATTSETATTDESGNWDQITTENVFEGENYRVIFTLNSYWDDGYNATIKLENIGESTIENWYLSFDYNSVITNIWNAEISTTNENKYVIKNLGWNKDISVGNSIEFGISSNQAFKGFPDNYEIIGTSTEVKEEDYTIKYNIDGDWGTGFYGSISVTNNTDTMLEDWVLEFDFDREITEIWDGVIEKHEGNHYIVKNAGYNANIDPKQTVTFGFKGNKGSKVNEPMNCVLSSSVHGRDDNVEISINTDQLKKNDTLEYYSIIETTNGLSGTLKNSQYVVNFCYEVKDLNDNVIETGDIIVADSWSAPDLKFTIGANIVNFTATTKHGRIIQKSIIIFNDKYDNLSGNLDMADSDGDGIVNYIEQFFGMDINKVDTDGDNLSDYEELLILGTDATMKDTDLDGIIDENEDADLDGLTAMEELKYGTNPFVVDSDGDGISDGDEVHKYGTNPINKDTDSDGVKDGKEIEIGTNPLIADDLFKVTATANSEDTVKVSVSTELSGNQVESLSVYRFENDFLFPETIPGYIGGAYDFSVDGTFDTATLYFEFDQRLLEDSSFDPIIYYYNEEEQLLEALDTTVTGNCASAVVSHFSKYILINRTVYEESFEWEDVWSTSGYTDVEVVFVIDDSGSMGWNDSSNKRLTVAKNLVDGLPINSSVGVVRFASYTTKLTEETTDKAIAKSYLNTTYFKSSGGTNMYTAINSSFSMFKSTDETTLRMMIVLSDGETSDTSKHSSVVSMANQKGVKIYTVGLGNSTTYFNRYLKPLANNTGAVFYLASNASELDEIYNDINKKIDIETDSDGDGIPDYYEDHLVMFNGVEIKTDKNNPDTDGDGLLDGEEVVELNYEYNATKTQVIVRGKILSNPFEQDSDGDGLLDADDPEPNKHFGTYLSGNIDFKLTDTITTPYNSAIEAAKAVTMSDYQRIYDERKPSWISNEYEDAIYILGIKTKARLMLSASYVGDATLIIAGGLSGQDIDINAGCYFLTYYLANIGGYEQYDGEFPAIKDENGLDCYNRYVNYLLNVCESGTKEGHTLKFTQIDAACGDTSVNYCPISFSTFNYWLAIKGGHIGMTGTCTYDGIYYSLDLYYCIQDYYDFYYDDPAGGQDSVGPVSNDEMAYLVLYDEAEPFENCGVYHVNIKWQKDQMLSEATQTSYAYTYLAH